MSELPGTPFHAGISSEEVAERRPVTSNSLRSTDSEHADGCKVDRQERPLEDTEAIEAVGELQEAAAAEEAKENALVKRHIHMNKAARMPTSFALGSLHGMTRWERVAHNVVSHPFFDSFVGCCICINAMTIGVETSHTTKDETPPGWVTTLEPIFLTIYTVELGMRLYAYKWKAFGSHWVKFDAFLVGSGLVDMFTRLLMTETSPKLLSDVMLIRMLRLARLARAARLLVQFRVLWLLVQGLMNSVLTVLWTFVLMMVLIYIFAVLGLEIIQPDESAGDGYEKGAKMFNEGLGFSMLTLVQFLTHDTIAHIYRGICIAKPWLIVYFAAFLLFVSIALMNLVTALMVDSAMNQSSQDKEAQAAWENANRKKALPKLKQMFSELDADGSGDLELEELLGAPQELKDQLALVANMEDCEELFKTLDVDGSNSVEVDEFCDSILKVAAADTATPELLRVSRMFANIQENSKATYKVLLEHFGGDPYEDMTPKASRRKSSMGSAMSMPTLTSDVGALVSNVNSVQDKLSGVETRISNFDGRISGIETNLQRLIHALQPQVGAAMASAPAAEALSTAPARHAARQPSWS